MVGKYQSSTGWEEHILPDLLNIDSVIEQIKMNKLAQAEAKEINH
jgi:hypothetical protein